MIEPVPAGVLGQEPTGIVRRSLPLFQRDRYRPEQVNNEVAEERMKRDAGDGLGEEVHEENHEEAVGLAHAGDGESEGRVMAADEDKREQNEHPEEHLSCFRWKDTQFMRPRLYRIMRIINVMLCITLSFTSSISSFLLISNNNIGYRNLLIMHTLDPRATRLGSARFAVAQTE